MNLPDLPLWLPVAVDTETNGLWADDGARISVVSLGWVEPDIVTGELKGLGHAVRTGEGVVSLALPFSQGIWTGRHGVKPDQNADLFDDPASNPNFGEPEWRALLEWLRVRPHVYHNAKFDLEKLRYGPIGWAGVEGYDFVGNCIWDTQVTAPEVWPGETSSLKPTAARLWGVGTNDEVEALKPYLGPKTDPRYDLVPWEVTGPYAAKDTELTIRLYYAELARIGLISADSAEVFAAVNEPLYRHCRKQVAVMRNLYRMERAGVPYSAAASLDAGEALETRKAELDRQLPFRPTGPAAVRYLFEEGQEKGPDGRIRNRLGLPPYERTDSGAPSFTADVVARMVRDYPADHEAGRVARIWQERSKLATAVKMWYRPYANGLGVDGRLRTCFRQVTRGRGTEDGGTRSGRFSVERVNLQAIPHDYRLSAGAEGGWTVPTPRQLIGQAARQYTGWELWEFDLAQAELRLAAAWSNCDRMLDAMTNGRDLHAETAAELFHVGPDHPKWGMYRQIGKRANFTLCFGAGGETFGKFVSKETGVQMGAAEADRLVRDWNRIYPEFSAAIDYWSQFAEQHRYVPLASVDGFATGRLRRFSDDEAKVGFHKAFNQLVQGSLGEFAKDWNLNTERICDEAGLGFVEGIGWTGMLIVIHDSQVILLPEGAAGEAIAKRATDGARDLWTSFFDRPDPKGRVSQIAGYAEGKRW